MASERNEPMNRACLLLGCALLSLLPASAAKRAEFRIRDPFVLVDNGTYYLYESKPWFGGKDVCVRTSTDLENWSEKSVVMQVPEGVPCTAVWAPEVHRFNGRYYLFVTLTEERGSRPIAKMGPLAAEKNLAPRGTWGFVADSPTGPFKALKRGPVPPADLMTLDGTLYVEDGKPWMVFCHEWCQMGNGTMECAPLTADLSAFASAPTRLFDAEGALPGAGRVTDGCFLYRSEKSGALYMIWSNMVKDHGYCVLVRRSDSGRLAGPWSKDEILYGKNGGHGMIFRDLQGKLRLTLHQPNKGELERMVLFELEDDGRNLRVK